MGDHEMTLEDRGCLKVWIRVPYAYTNGTPLVTLPQI